MEEKPLILDSDEAKSPKNVDNDLKIIEILSNWSDSKFKLPFTDIRFGLDSVIGLIPYAGDLMGLGFSGILITLMARNGATPMLLLRMAGNVILDTLVGAIPILGDIFDVTFKSNRRNLALLKKHYSENGAQEGTFSRSIMVLAIILLILMLVFVIAFFKFAIFLWKQF